MQCFRPVLVAFYNGGYLGTSETWSMLLPAYLVLDVDDRNDCVIAYANHRTSVFGYLAGTKVAEHPDVDLNPEFLNQKAALEWVKKYVHHLGGKVTI
ncbi:alpha/beta-hydrolase [Curvularia clavata]|uniref:Alpha/beta-hydrolase n=1 Tax=Curvularia clavata TaxID=95742 RepID=A0A9Q9DY04_CURCL|nr:alpha/beta-hydrolase [Curvularia clavata]